MPQKPLLCFFVFSFFSSHLFLVSGCEKIGCLSGGDDCIVPSPCQKLSFQCSDEDIEIKFIEGTDEIPGGLDALGAVGDILLRNSKVAVVIERLDNPNYFSTTGGMITDISTIGDDNDSLAHIEQVTGLLPGDAVAYTSFEILPFETGSRAVQFKGHLAGNPDHRVATRYEIRACEPGIRIRTELINNGGEDVVWSFGDGFYWSKRSSSPFIPATGAGFSHPAFSLGSVNNIIREVPFMVGSSSVAPAASYAEIGCNVDTLEGFHSAEVSLVGLPRRIVTTGDYDVFERFIAAANGMGVSPGADLALELRSQLHQEAFITLSGSIALEGGRESLGEPIRASVHVFEGRAVDLKGIRIPWTTVNPDSGGAFQARLPADKNYVAEVMAFGRVVAQREFTAQTSDLDLGTLSIPAVSSLTVSVLLDGQPKDALVFLYPADDETQRATQARWNDFFFSNPLCAPLLGAPHGDSPACNRILAGANTTIDVPPGSYDVFATTGLLSSLGRSRITLAAGSTESLTFELTRLPLRPDNSLSADFHVHGAKSFDTNLPDTPRVQSFLAAEMDVIAATDHDAIWDYAEAMEALDVGNQIVLLVGLETTGHALWNFNPEVLYPQVIGHYNFWPLTFDNRLPRNGAAYDEFVEPGLLFTKMGAAGLTRSGVIQLNHPWTAGTVGRDFGFPYALGLNLSEPLPLFDDGSAGGIFVRKPFGSEYYNSDHHTQEVMNGTENEDFHGYRAFWFYLLNQGYLKAGTANSDSHTLEDNIVGTPRTLVFTETTKENFDAALFNDDVKRGKMIGTNGPIIEAEIEGSADQWHGPSIDLFPLRSNADLKIKVSAAPWVPVDEIRIFVNGEIVARILDGISDPTDTLGTEGLVRYDSTIALSNFLPQENTDAWLVIEAGAVMPINEDLNCDGVPDTGDNNNDGVVDWRDIDRNEDGLVNAEDLDLDNDGQADDGEAVDTTQGPVGPLKLPPPPLPEDPAYDFAAVTPKGYPLAFTNPFIMDRNLNGQFEPPGPRQKPTACEVSP